MVRYLARLRNFGLAALAAVNVVFYSPDAETQVKRVKNDGTVIVGLDNIVYHALAERYVSDITSNEIGATPKTKFFTPQGPYTAGEIIQGIAKILLYEGTASVCYLEKLCATPEYCLSELVRKDFASAETLLSKFDTGAYENPSANNSIVGYSRPSVEVVMDPESPNNSETKQVNSLYNYPQVYNGPYTTAPILAPILAPASGTILNVFNPIMTILNVFNPIMTIGTTCVW